MSFDPTKTTLVIMQASKVTVGDRMRRADADISAMKASIEKHGQIHPIVLNRDNSLVAGFRRLQACKALNIPVVCVYRDQLNALQAKELELEENICRKEMSWSDQVLAKQELDRLKKELYGERHKGSQKSAGWSTKDTAKALGESTKQTRDDIALAGLIKKMPSLANIGTKGQALRAAREITIREKFASDAEKKVTPAVKEMVLLGRCEAVLQTLKPRYYDVICTDPPFGTDHNKNIKQTKNAPVGEQHTSYMKLYSDTKSEYVIMMGRIIPELSRVAKDESFLYCFCQPMWFPMLVGLFMDNGFSVCPFPLLWIKPVIGATVRPMTWPSQSYECCLFGRKGNILLVEPFKAWFMQDRLNPNDKHHPVEKPVDLLYNMLKPIARPGMTLIDPFAGSGSTLVAALKHKMIPQGIEMDKDYRHYALDNLTKYYAKKGE
ncbi:MAG: DNA methyltransferase [Candidatus Paceibacterota bacterium]